MPLNSLPTELLLHIAGFAGPASIRGLALTSKHLADQLHDELLNHQYCHKHFRTVQEHHEGLLDTLRYDSTAPWHVRKFRQAAHFREMLRLGDIDRIEPRTDTDDVQGVIMKAKQRDHLEEFCDAVRSHESFLELAERASRLASKRSAQNILMFALCSNIRYWEIKRPYLATNMDFNMLRGPAGSGRASFNSPFLARVLSVLHTLQSPKDLWLPGFISLRKVSVGAPSQPDPEKTVARVGEVLPLFLLPNLETVYVRGLTIDGIEARDWATNGPRSSLYRLPNNSSSVRNICFDETHRTLVRLIIENIIEACRQLETFVVKSCEISNFDGISTRLVEKHGPTLENFFCYGDVSELKACGGAWFETTKNYLTNPISIKILSVDIVTLAKGALIDHRWDGHELYDVVKANRFDNRGDSNELVRYFEEYVGLHLASLETLIVQVQHGTAFTETDFRRIDEAFARLLQPTNDSNRNGDEANEVNTEKLLCPYLKRLYLDLVIAAGPSANDFGLLQRIALFSKTREQASRRGIGAYVEFGAAERYMQELSDGIFKL